METTILCCNINIPGTVGGGWPPVGGADGCWACAYGGALLGGYGEALFGGFCEPVFGGYVGAAKNKRMKFIP